MYGKEEKKTKKGWWPKKGSRYQARGENGDPDHTVGSQTGEMKCTQDRTLLEGTELPKAEKPTSRNNVKIRYPERVSLCSWMSWKKIRISGFLERTLS